MFVKGEKIAARNQSVTVVRGESECAARIQFGEAGEFVSCDVADCGKGGEHDRQIGGMIGPRVGGNGRDGTAGTEDASLRKQIGAVGFDQEAVGRGCGGGSADAGCGGIAERAGERDKTTKSQPVTQNVTRATETVGHERGDAAGEGFDRRNQRTPCTRAMEHDRSAASGRQFQLTLQHRALDAGHWLGPNAVQTALAHGCRRMGMKQRAEPIIPSSGKMGCLPRMDAPGAKDHRTFAHQRGNRVPVIRRGCAAAKARDPGPAGGIQHGGPASGEARILNVCVGVEHGAQRIKDQGSRVGAR